MLTLVSPRLGKQEIRFNQACSSGSGCAQATVQSEGTGTSRSPSSQEAMPARGLAPSAGETGGFAQIHEPWSTEAQPLRTPIQQPGEHIRPDEGLGWTHSQALPPSAKAIRLTKICASVMNTCLGHSPTYLLLQLHPGVFVSARWQSEKHPDSVRWTLASNKRCLLASLPVVPLVVLSGANFAWFFVSLRANPLRC